MLFTRLKIILIFGLIIPNLQPVVSQDFLEEFESLITEEKIKLLPEKMIFTQKLFWGEKGLLRKTGVSNLTLVNREKELVLREKMLKAHQIIGYITFAGMIYQGILGGKVYSGDYSYYDIHKTVGKIVTATYFTGAGLSLFAPPPLVSRKNEGLNNIKVHKILANIHVPAMIMTNALSNKNRKAHKVSAYTAFASYSFAMLSIILDF